MRQRQRLRDLLADTRGVSMTEYLIIVCLVAIVGIAAWTKFGNTVRTRIGGPRTSSP
jgi:Flp pilus assembly pilin Flp